ncbi:MAG: manganese efflux pump MntP family protein [Oscillospiraceae bacterium]|nr:manganese efflux pump MntP family protein [Oscillospiraceae bacterium]
MSFVELLFIAVGLSMDAFAIAVCKGFSLKKPRFRECVLVGVYFGASQAIMPLIGYAVASRFAHIVTAWDHWIAFVLLGVLGGKMLYDGLKNGGGDDARDARLHFKVMLPLAVADSIDALAVGISFAFLKVAIIPCSAVIGVTTLILSAVGVAVGGKFGAKLGTKATIAGGAILILLGVKVLLEHLLAVG